MQMLLFFACVNLFYRADNEIIIAFRALYQRVFLLLPIVAVLYLVQRYWKIGIAVFLQLFHQIRPDPVFSVVKQAFIVSGTDLRERAAARLQILQRCILKKDIEQGNGYFFLLIE